MNIFKNLQKLQKRNKLGKKAQVSFFVILGVILFVAMLAGYFVYNNIKKSNIEEQAKRTAELNLQAEEIRKFVNDCIRKESFEGLKTLGQTGGYVDVPRLINFKGIAMWHLDQVNIQPFLNQTQQRLIEYVNTNVPKCVENENISKFGFLIEKTRLTTNIEFGNSDVTLKVTYPIKLSKEGFTKEFSEFFNTFDIRYRAVFEAATEINTKLFEPDFEAKDPFKKLEYLKNLDFDISYKTPETDVMTFAVTDRRSVTPENRNFVFSFAAKLGRSELKRLTDLQNRSASNPVFLPYTIFSVDRKAQLDISSETTISLNGQDVSGISVQQNYPSEVVTKDIPVEKENKEIKKREDLVYVIDNPVYSFEPDSLLFNKPQKLTLYYDDPQGKDAKGVGILKGKKGFWVPIPSFEDIINRKVFANIIGFTDFTVIFCESQKLKKVVARQVFEPNSGCYVQLAITIIAIALLIYFGPILLTAFSAGGGGFAGIGASVIGALPASITTTTTFSLSTLTAIGIAYTAFTALSLSLSVVSTATESFYSESPENCQGFVPTCTWQVGIDTVTKDGEGKCIPDGGTMQAGIPVTLCARVEKCNFIQKFTCQKCSVECTAQFY